MELRQLEHFLAVVRTGSFTAAAHEVHIVQSALSTSIRRLETELDATLFERTTRRVVLTEAGRALVPAARRIVADVVAARDEVSAVTGLSSGRVAIGTVQMLPEVDLSAELGRFRARYPGVRIYARDGAGSTLADAVRDGELDLAYVAVDADLPDGVVSFAHWRQRLVVLSYDGHRLAGRSAVRLADCDGEPFVDYAGSSLQGLLTRTFADAGLARNQVCEATHIPLLVGMVAAGLGVSIVPELVAERSGLPFALLEQPSLTRSVHLVGRLAELTNPAARALADQLTA